MFTVNVILLFGLVLVGFIITLRDKKSFNLMMLVLVLFSVFISLLISERTTNYGDMIQNDTAVYNNYFNCLKEGRLKGCENVVIEIPGNELMLGMIARTVIFFKLDNSIIFFIISFFLCSSYLYFIRPLGVLMPLGFFLFLTSPIFWELSSNVIRASLSVSFFLLLISMFAMGNHSSYKKVTMYVGGCLSHSSFFIYTPLFLLYRKIKVETLFILFLCGLALSPILTKFLFGFIGLLLSDFIIGKKIVFYMSKSTGSGVMNYIYVIGKMNIVMIFFLYSVYKQTKNEWFISTFKVLLLLLVAGSFLGDTNFVYRIINVYELLLIPLIVFSLKTRAKYVGVVFVIYATYKLYMFDYFYENYIRFFQ
ncbi:EpsG family protein [Colwellia sp. Bg11-12]|jgi:hypothetical protein|uniref:EpsG family protein n=1 Tax=Colwellia sp. Bg11-12 TaxID=2759817 RepID=UPI0015F4F40B|nr:EpsG family protein [Colwellia sp. Bg11-12]MBA6264790.1 EpsG family protein [Colwellia sp. Bg11-12]